MPARLEPQAAHRLEAGQHRAARAGHPRRPEPVERLARVTREHGQGAPERRRRILSRKAGESFDGGVHPVEQRGLPRRRVARNGRLRKTVTPARRPGRQRDQLCGALALVHAPRQAPELRVGGAEQGVVAAQVHRAHARIRRRPAAESRPATAHAERKSDPEVELLRLPGNQPLGNLLREATRNRRRRATLRARAPPTPGDAGRRRALREAGRRRRRGE